MITAIVGLITAYAGRSVDRVLIVRAFTKRGMPLAGFRARDFITKPDISCLIA